jgi:signal transduction histidine kinase
MEPRMSAVPPRNALLRLASFLRDNRATLLSAWRAAVDNDPQISTAETLARAQFIDHIPRILDAFELQLAARGAEQQAEARDERRRGVLDHGISRWLHGYHYRETMREWGHLQTCLAAKVEEFAISESDLDARAMRVARELLVQLFVDCMTEGAAAQVRLQQTEASSRLRDLEQALEQLRALERERADLWHEATHDLRGNLNAVQLAATAFARAPAPLPGAEIIERTTHTLTALLDDLTALARLEAGRELRGIGEFDADALLRELCAAMQPLATERQLTLSSELTPLRVSGDAVKVRRIAQNLILNGLKFTERGGVHVTAGPTQLAGVDSWQLTVADTGVGISERASPAITRLLRAATREDEAQARSSFAPVQTLPSESARTPGSATGEGVGLIIVKRLCELLDATIHIESTPGSGTTFRIMFPRSYPPSPPPRP